jgi:uncharacterized iron-regulated membrane protein
MANDQVIERYRVYTRDEAAALMRMTAMEMDDLLQARGMAVIDTGHHQVYLGETLLRAMGAFLRALCFASIASLSPRIMRRLQHCRNLLSSTSPLGKSE